MNELIMYSKEFNETYIQRGESLFQKAGGKEEEVTLAVVIICCNEEDVILPCINSLHILPGAMILQQPEILAWNRQKAIGFSFWMRMKA